MSENIDTLKAGFEAWNAKDIEAFRDCYDADAIIVRGLEGWPEPAPFVGREAVMRQFERVRADWDSDSFNPIGDFIEVGERIVVRCAWEGTSSQSPVLQVEMSIVYTMRNSKVFLLEYFWDHQQALKSLGLGTQVGAADLRDQA